MAKRPPQSVAPKGRNGKGRTGSNFGLTNGGDRTVTKVSKNFAK